MNSDSEAIKSLLAWLLQDLDSTVVTPSGDISSLKTGSDESGVGDPLLNHLDPLDSEEVGVFPDSLWQSNRFSIGENSFFELGDIPAVQDRFHTLLKRRLRAEIERNPPRFPWETGVSHYGAEAQNGVAPELIPASFWAVHLQNLDLPIALPEAVLASLLEQCQTVVQSSRREGAKLVQAVESLFPGQSQLLNQLAGLVMASPVRSGTIAPSLAATGFPSHYEAATTTQQMAVTLLAAREIMESLTLVLTPNCDLVERQWSTAAGDLTLAAEYRTGRLRVLGQLPCEGSFRVEGDRAQSTAQRNDAGNLSLELLDLPPAQTCTLEVQLADQSPLVFGIRLVPESNS